MLAPCYFCAETLEISRETQSLEMWLVHFFESKGNLVRDFLKSLKAEFSDTVKGHYENLVGGIVHASDLIAKRLQLINPALD